MNDKSTPICCGCFKPLTETERHYYETRCEVCEGLVFERTQKWLRGHQDAELDGLYSPNR